MEDIQEQLASLIGQTPEERKASLRQLQDREREPKFPAAAADLSDIEVPSLESFTNKAREEPSPVQPIGASVDEHKAMVSFAYGFTPQNPGWTKPLKDALVSQGYLVYNPFDVVEQQFNPEDLPSLLNLNTKLVASLARLFKLPELLTLPMDNNGVIQLFRQGDAKGEFNAVLLKDLYFMSRSAVVICDLMQEPVSPDLVQKLMYCKMLDIPIVGIGSAGQPFMQRLIKVVMTDDFTVANVLPLVRAYCG